MKIKFTDNLGSTLVINKSAKEVEVETRLDVFLKSKVYGYVNDRIEYIDKGISYFPIILTENGLENYKEICDFIKAELPIGEGAKLSIPSEDGSPYPWDSSVEWISMDGNISEQIKGSRICPIRGLFENTGIGCSIYIPKEVSTLTIKKYLSKGLEVFMKRNDYGEYLAAGVHLEYTSNTPLPKFVLLPDGDISDYLNDPQLKSTEIHLDLTEKGVRNIDKILNFIRSLIDLPEGSEYSFNWVGWGCPNKKIEGFRWFSVN